MKVHDDAILAPAIRPQTLVGRYLTRFGRYDGAGRPIGGWPIFTSLKSTLPWQPRRPPEVSTPPVERPMIYAGLLIGWFGHFIIESLPNLLAVAEAKRQFPEAGIIAHGWGPVDAPRWRAEHARHLDYFCDKLGLDPDEIAFVNAPMRLRRLIVPRAPFPRKFLFEPWVLARIDSLWPQPERRERLYFSRGKVAGRPRLIDEAGIETVFARNGYRIVHPETLGLEAQIALVRGAEVVAGPQGSALHWTLYGAQCRAVLSLGYPSWLQRGICHSRGQAYVELRGKRPRGAERRQRALSEAALQRAIDRIG